MVKSAAQQINIRFLIFKEHGTWFGVALELNIVVEAMSEQGALTELHEAIQGYIEAVQSAKQPPDLLRQKPDAAYEKMWQNIQLNSSAKRRPVRSPYYFGNHVIPV